MKFNKTIKEFDNWSTLIAAVHSEQALGSYMKHLCNVFGRMTHHLPYCESKTMILHSERPGTDRTSKIVLKHAEVKDIIATAAVGVNGDVYSIGDSERLDGSQSDVVYQPFNLTEHHQ
jgi:hypothetical protein